MPDSRDMASCVVSFLDTEGLRHTVEVEAEVYMRPLSWR
jgi:hypothetical protein